MKEYQSPMGEIIELEFDEEICADVNASMGIANKNGLFEEDE